MDSAMKAAIYRRYGSPDVIELADVTMPVPKDHEVLIRVYATTVTSGDWRVRSLVLPRGFGWMGRMIFGFSTPRQPILGTELSGVIESVGSAVTMFKPGDAVFAFTGASMGCHAEYKCLSQTAAIAHKPANLSFAEAAALSFGGTTALDFFRRGQLKSGERVLINGASGGVGSAAVQLAKHFGAHITAVCSGSNRDLVTSLGADEVIDYNQVDFTKNGQAYDLIMDTVGTAPYARCKGSLTEGGRLLLVLGDLAALLHAPWIGMTTKHRVIAGPAPERAEDLRELATLAEAGHFKPIIDRRIPFTNIRDAHHLVDTGRKKGNVIVTVHSSAA